MTKSNTILTAIAATLLSTSAMAEHVYHGLASGNADLYSDHARGAAMGTNSTHIGSFDVYRGLADGNNDLFRAVNMPSATTDLPDIYRGFGGNPDLRY